MIIIKNLFEMVDDELKDAEKYIMYALKYKIDNPSLAKTFYDISLQEMTHADIFNNEIVKLISQNPKEQSDNLITIQVIYDYLRDRQTKKANEIKMYQSQFRS